MPGPYLFPEASTSDDKGAQNSSAQSAPHVVIAIDRQFGSGGHDIGKAIAKRLGWKFYDSELIQMAAGTTGYTPEFVRSREEKMTGSLLYDLVNQMYIYSSEHMAPTDQIFNAESDAIRELVGKENCVITGRCADYILRDDPACLRVFLQAPLSYRIRRHIAISDRRLNRMEQKNMIQRRMLDGNRRSLHVFLTPSGRRDQEAVRDAFLRLEEQVFQGIAEEDREVFMRIFQRIYDNLSEGGR